MLHVQGGGRRRELFPPHPYLYSYSGAAQLTYSMGDTSPTTQLPSLADLLLSTAKPSVASTSKLTAEALASREAQIYLARLLSLPLDDLQREPDTLATSSSQLDTDLAHLCFRSYPTFLLSRSASTSIEGSFASLSSSLDALVSSADGLGSACAAFASLVSPIQSQRAKTVQVLDQIDKVAEVLELPRLVGTCVRSGGLWNEALDLAARADELCTRAPDNAALRRVKREVDREVVGLEARVLEALRERSLKLPGAVRSITLLRRMRKGAGDARLAQILLCSRWDCLRVQLDQLQSGLYVGDDRVRHLKRWIELWREVIGETASMYTDIFPEPSLSSLLRQYLQHALSSLLTSLDTHLLHITSTAALSSILTQLAYAGQAFTRAHALDFRSLAAERISQRVLALITGRLAEATDALRTELRSGKPASYPSPPPIPDWSSTAPHCLTTVPPLARLVNAHAATLNELRLLPALSLRPLVTSALASELHGAIEACAADVTLTSWLARVVIPWCERALAVGVYGDEAYIEAEVFRSTRERCEPAVAVKAVEVNAVEVNGVDEEH